jgi:hypothetical protein
VIQGLGRSAVGDLTKKYSVGAASITTKPEHLLALKKARVGLYRPWAASIDEGWTRWVLENAGFNPISIYNADMRSANLISRYDVIVLPDLSTDTLLEGIHIGVVPGQYEGGIGKEGVDNLSEFVRDGGTLVAFNTTSANLIPLMSLPVRNALDGLTSEKFFCSGALLRVEQEHDELPINFGIPDAPVVMFQRGPAFVPLPGFQGAVLARYAKSANPLESGLLLHPEAIEDKAAALELAYGKGHILLYGFKPQFRGQSHGTYRYLFNALYSYEQPVLPKLPATPAVETTPPPAPPAEKKKGEPEPD